MPALDASLLPSSADADIVQQNHKIFRIYHYYRLALSLILLISYFYRTPSSPLGSVDQELFVRICSFYLLTNLLILLVTPIRIKASARVRVLFSFSILILDILLLTVLSYTCGGVSSGMAHLMIVPVATGSILFGTRLGIFFASIGSIAAIYSETYLSFTLPTTENFYVQAGLLGLILFVTSLCLQYLGHRIRQKEMINRQQAVSIHALQEINQQIIQRMQTGIVVINKEGLVFNSNSSARRLLTASGSDSEASLTRIPDALAQQLQLWLQQPETHYPPFRTAPNAPDILANYSFLQTDAEPNILIFLEDYTQLSSRAQHLKLMSLGRLSASIAHEIRNPLGAISHACQLLGESEKIENEDKRLLAIINTHTQRVNTIIENILEHSGPRHLIPEVFELKPWLEQFVLRFSNSYSQQIACDLKLEHEQLRLRFNQNQLEQLLTNLCDNAIRYSEKNTGILSVSIHAYLNQQNHCPVIDVIDQGRGVSEKEAEQIFEPFFTTESKGTGLGLFICKEICEANQARIFYCRTNDGASCLRIQFAHPDRNIS